MPARTKNDRDILKPGADGHGYIDRVRSDTLEIRIETAADGPRVWVHIDGELVLRAYRVAELTLEDQRPDPNRGHNFRD